MSRLRRAASVATHLSNELTRAHACAPIRRPVLIKEKEDMAKAAAMIGAAFRGVKTRGQVTVLKGEKQLTDAKTKWGFLEKRSSKRSFIFGSRQVVLWQRKFVRIHDYHFCYTSTAPQVRRAQSSSVGCSVSARG